MCWYVKERSVSNHTPPQKNCEYTLPSCSTNHNMEVYMYFHVYLYIGVGMFSYLLEILLHELEWEEKEVGDKRMMERSWRELGDREICVNINTCIYTC